MNQQILTDISNFIFIKGKPEKADIIFLPGGSCPEPPEYAALLYQKEFAPLLLPSGGVSVKYGRFVGVKTKKEIYNREYQTDCEFYTDVLIKNGVPESAVIGEDKSGHTYDNAFFSRKVVNENGLLIKKAMIVCKSFHARRCLMLYQLAFPEVQLIVVPVDCQNITRENWYTSDAGIDRVFGELARCGNQFVEEMKEYLKWAV